MKGERSMEFLRRSVLFLLGFVAAASIVIADDRMAMNYVYSSALDVNEEVRSFVLAARERWELGNRKEEWDPQVLETFITQKI